MNVYWSFLLLSVLALLQGTLLPQVKVLGTQPDLVLLTVVSWSLLCGAEEGMMWALIGGLALDLLSSAQLGVNTLPLLLISFLAGLWQRGIVRLDVLVPLLAIPIATLVYQGAMVGLLQRTLPARRRGSPAYRNDERAGVAQGHVFYLRYLRQ